jgi:TIR domain
VKAVVQNRVDFFVSRAGADAGAAELVAAIIREAGLVPFYQNEDFGHADFMRRMEQGYESNARMIALLSAEYQQSEFCRAEYNHVLAKDPANLEERLIVLRVATCDPVGSLQNLAYTDLVPVMSDRSALTRVGPCGDRGRSEVQRPRILATLEARWSANPTSGDSRFQEFHRPHQPSREPRSQAVGRSRHRRDSQFG